MFSVYVYVFDTLADWEIGYAAAELNSGRFFKENAPQISFKTVGSSKEAVRTMGGMTVIPDCTIEDIAENEESVLLLPGGNTWNDSKQSAVLDKAEKLLAAGGTVCAICGATAAIANRGILDSRPHTSNGKGFLEMFSPAYKGTNFYVDKLSVSDNNLITAGSSGSLEWARDIIMRLGVFEANTTDAWYEYFRTGKAEHFFALMQSLPSAKNN